MNLILVSTSTHIHLFTISFNVFCVDAVSDNEEEKKDVPAFADEDTVDAEALEKKKKEE